MIGGAFTTIVNSLVSKQLTEYQRWIQQNILVHLPVHPCATAYKPGSSVKRNAAPHVGHRQLVKVDLKDYFGHISFHKVKKVFLDAGYSGKVSTTLIFWDNSNFFLPYK